MPAIRLNLDALRWNARQSAACARRWGARILPVMKGVLSHPLALRELAAEGFVRYAFAEYGELFSGGTPSVPQVENRVLMQICPLSRVGEVAAGFGRSTHSVPATLTALDGAAGALGRRHEVMLALDVGEFREGAPRESLPALLDHALSLPNLDVAGLFVTLGCMGWREPGEDFGAMLDAVLDLFRAKGIADPEVSLGGSIVCPWLDRHGPGAVTEVRLGAHFILGEDTYHRCDLPGGPFRRDVCTLSAEVLEIHPRRFAAEDKPAFADGECLPPFRLPPPGIRLCALLDIGRAHVAPEDLVGISLPGAFPIASGTGYTVLDVTDCPCPPGVGDRLFFRPGYWSILRAFHSPLVALIPVRDDHPAEGDGG